MKGTCRSEARVSNLSNCKGKKTMGCVFGVVGLELEQAALPLDGEGPQRPGCGCGLLPGALCWTK